MRKITISLIMLVIICVAVMLPLAATSQSNSLVVSYGETTYHNSQYKSFVDNYFVNNAHINMNDVESEVVSAEDVNEISSGISQRTYSSNQIFSSALLDLNETNGITITVDTSKITTVTPAMFKTALDSAGINQGHVYVTSPVVSTGESALAGIMDSYEEATDIEIPDKVKEAVNGEIHAQSEIVNNSNVDGDKLANLVSDVKEQVKQENTSSKDTIINIINNVAIQNNINLSDADVDKLADAISQSQSVQDQASQYKQQLDSFLKSDEGQSIFNQIISYIKNFFN